MKYIFCLTPTFGVLALYGLCWLFGLPTGGWELMKVPFYFSLAMSGLLALFAYLLDK